MKKLDSLLNCLASLGLHPERRQLLRIAADNGDDLPDVSRDLKPLKRMPYEPDETAWSENAEEFGDDVEEESSQQLLERTVPVPKKVFIDTYGLGRGVGEFNDLVMRSLTDHGIRPIGSMAWDDMLGSGAFGTVFRAVYNGAPVVVKVSISNNPKARDVEVWKKILSIWDNIPSQYKKHIQQVYLVYSELIPFNGDSIKLQVIVSEELRELSEGAVRLIAGKDMSIEKIDDNLANLVKQINDKICGPHKMEPVTVTSISVAIQSGIAADLANRNHKERGYDQGRPMPSNFGVVRQASPALISEAVKNYLLPLATTMKSRVAITFGVPDIICEVFSVGLAGTASLPRDHDIPTAKNYSAPREVSMVYETIRWLDDHGISWGDLHAYNMMLGKDNNIKITDVGNFTIK